MKDSKSVSEESKASASSTEIFSDKVMTKIWVRMLAIYGHKWASHLGAAVDADGRLSESAHTWQQGLVGVSLENLKTAFDALVLKNQEWPPSLPEFRKLCLSGIRADAPSLDEIVSMLISVSTRQGSLASRYRHPMALAVSLACLRNGVDMFAIRNAKLIDAKRMIKPAYEQYLKTGWNDWTEDELKEPDSGQKALGHDKPVSKSAGRSFFSEIKTSL